jgi:hypothetical protein
LEEELDELTGNWQQHYGKEIMQVMGTNNVV